MEAGKQGRRAGTQGRKSAGSPGVAGRGSHSKQQRDHMGCARGVERQRRAEQLQTGQCVEEGR